MLPKAPITMLLGIIVSKLGRDTNIAESLDANS